MPSMVGTETQCSGLISAPIHHLVLGQLPTSKHLYSDCKKEAVTPTQPVQVNVLSPRWDPGRQNIPQIALCSPFLWSIFPDLKCKANLNYTRHCISKKKWWSRVLGGGSSAVETSRYWMLFQRPWLGSQHLHNGSPQSVTPVLGDLPSSGLFRYCIRECTRYVQA